MPSSEWIEAAEHHEAQQTQIKIDGLLAKYTLLRSYLKQIINDEDSNAKGLQMIAEEALEEVDKI